MTTCGPLSKSILQACPGDACADPAEASWSLFGSGAPARAAGLPTGSRLHASDDVHDKLDSPRGDSTEFHSLDGSHQLDCDCQEILLCSPDGACNANGPVRRVHSSETYLLPTANPGAVQRPHKGLTQRTPSPSAHCGPAGPSDGYPHRQGLPVTAESQLGQETGLGSTISGEEKRPSTAKLLARALNHDISNLRLNPRLQHPFAAPQPLREARQPLLDADLEEEASQEKKKKSKHPQKSSKSSTVLYVKGVDPNRVEIQDLCNLFSNYGNVEMGVMHKNKDFALIKYTTVRGAELGLEQLNKVSIFGFRMSIFFSKYEQIMEKRYHNNKEYCVPDPEYRRFKNEVPTQVNPISRTLHICIFQPNPKRVISESDVQKLISPFAECSRLQRDQNSSQLNMWFAEFQSRASAVLVLMKLHDSKFENGNIRVSFTRTKKCQA
jgi:RNA recognition motif. (a.k.a. RRM, RBD, or RNP domain)